MERYVCLARIAIICLAIDAFTCSVALAQTKTTAPASEHGKTPQGSDEIFSSTNVFRLQIEFTKEGMSKLRGYQWDWGCDKTDRPFALATVKEGGRVYTNVAIHLNVRREVSGRAIFRLQCTKLA